MIDMISEDYQMISSQEIAISLYDMGKYNQALPYFSDAHNNINNPFVVNDSFVVKYANCLLKCRLYDECEKFCLSLMEKEIFIELIMQALYLVYFKKNMKKECIDLRVDIYNRFPTWDNKFNILSMLWSIYGIEEFEAECEKIKQLGIVTSFDIEQAKKVYSKMNTG